MGVQVSNKAVEILMLRQGFDVCCVSEQDRSRAQRYEALQRAAGQA